MGAGRHSGSRPASVHHQPSFDEGYQCGPARHYTASQLINIVQWSNPPTVELQLSKDLNIQGVIIPLIFLPRSFKTLFKDLDTERVSQV